MGSEPRCPTPVVCHGVFILLSKTYLGEDSVLPCTPGDSVHMAWHCHTHQSCSEGEGRGTPALGAQMGIKTC